MSLDAAFAELTSLVQRAHTLGTVGELLGWDEQVNLPPGAAEQRAAQHAALAEAVHAAASERRIGELLADLEKQAVALTPDQKVVVAQARKDFDRATKLPAEFVREKAAQGSRGYHAWAKAKANDDFASYAPVLEKNLEFAKREAAYLGWGGREYDYMLDKHDPGLTAVAVDRLFGELKRELVPLMREITVSPTAARAKAAAGKLRGFPVEGQRAFLREVTEKIGFDYGRGRIDVSLHPFCSGTGSDVRMTTRFKEDEPLDSLFSSIPRDGAWALRAGAAGGAARHGARHARGHGGARVAESLVGKPSGTESGFLAEFRAAVSCAVSDADSGAECGGALSRGESRGADVDSRRCGRGDLQSAHHSALRDGKKLFTGELAVRDLPAAWRAASREIVGLEPANDRTGVLQDVHWSDGAFGYFPSYCLGNMLAAQLWYRAQELRPGLEAEFARGDFSWLLAWLREQVHAQGRRFDALELARRVTGEELSPKALVRYLRDRYGALYLG